MLFDVRSGMRVGAGLLAVAALVSLGACGRRGPLEAPPSASTGPERPAQATRKVVAAPPAPTLVAQPQAATLDTPDDETDVLDPAESVLPTPTPTPPGTRRRGRSYVVPKEPFLLDPLL